MWAVLGGRWRQRVPLGPIDGSGAPLGAGPECLATGGERPATVGCAMTSMTAATTSGTRRALDLARRGEPLDVTSATALLSVDGADFEELLDLAGALRDEGLAAAGRAGVITYSRKVFVPLTTLCRDRCHYCIFVDTPGQLLRQHKPVYMSPQQVLSVVRQGAAMGCKEALLTLGDRPEDRWPEARQWLDEHGFASTLDYVG